MSEVDLIPSSYRRLLSHIRLLKNLAVTVVGIMIIAGMMFIYLNHEITRLHMEVAEFQEKKNVSVRQNEQLVRLQEAKMKYGKQLELLNKLRRGATVGLMFQVIDNALAEENLWFLKLRMTRADVLVAQGVKPQPTSNTGVSVPLTEKEKGIEMVIKGQAQDYETLSRFVSNLLDQREIKGVRILNSSLRRYTTSSVVDFDLSVDVRQEGA